MSGAVICATLVSATGAARASAQPAGALAAPSPVHDWTDVAVKLPVSGIAFDATRNELLASIPNSVPGLGNDVVELDPSTGALGRSLFVGASPGSLAVSQDGTTLYVALSGASLIERVDLATFTVVSSFSTGSGFEGPNVPEQLAVVPGDDDAVVATLANECCSPSFADFVVFDNGVARPQHDPYPGTFVTSFAFGSDPSTLYGYNADDTGFDLSTWALDSTGLTRTDDSEGLIAGFGEYIEYAAPYVYASNGQVVDPATAELVATIPSHGEAVDPVPAANRAYYVSDSRLEEYRLDTFAPVSTKRLSGHPGAGFGFSRIVSTNVGLAVVEAGALHLVGQGIGPVVPIKLPHVVNHVHGLVAQTISGIGAQGMTFDPVTNTLLVSIGATAKKYANNLVEMDPATGTIGRHVFVGSDPGLLALSSDGSTLYMGLMGSNSVVQVSMATFSVVTSFSLGSDDFLGPYFAGAIAIQPGTPTTIAVTRITPGFSPDAQGGVAIYDNGVQRPNVGGDAFSGIDSIAFGTDPNTLYTSDTSSTAATVNIMKLNAKGARIVRSNDRVSGGPIVGVANGKVYTSCTVIDAKTLDLVGQFAGCIDALDASDDRAYGLGEVAGAFTEYQISTLRTVKTVAEGADLANQIVVTSAGFATLDPFDETLTLLVRS